VADWLDSGHATLLLRCDTGIGKTHAAIAVVNEAMRRPRPPQAMIWSATELNEALRPSRPDAEQVKARIMTTGLLVVDDVGREKISEWTLQELGSILEGRWRTRSLGRRNIFTTNLFYDEGQPDQVGYPRRPNLLERYDSRIAERLVDDAVIVQLYGESRRAPASWDWQGEEDG
jgi:DNA replication protein DnaC